MTASEVRGKLGGGGIEQKGKRTHGHGQQCDDYRGRGHRGLNDNGKNTYIHTYIHTYINENKQITSKIETDS